MIARLPSSKQEKINSLIKTVLQSPCRKNLEKIIGILLWATSLVHHVRFLLTSLYRDLSSIPWTNYSIEPTEWESFLNLLNDCARITTHNHLHLPVGSRVVEFKHAPISSSSQLPRDVPIERHVWIRLRDPNCEKRRLSDTSKETLLWSKESLLPLLRSIPLNRSTQMTTTAAADAFATEEKMGIGGWIKLEEKLFWFSHIWNKQELQPFLDIPKSLQRYDTFLHGKHWLNFASCSWSTRNVLPDRVSSVSNQDQTTLVQRPTSTTASPTLRSFQISSN